MPLTNSTPRPWLYLLLLVAYVAMAYLFSSFSPQAQVVALWPSAGIGLVGTLVFGWRFLPAIVLGSVCFNAGIQFSGFNDSLPPILASAFGMGCGSSLQAWLNYRLLQHYRLDILDAPSYRHVGLFIIFALACCSVSAVIGNAILAYAGASVDSLLPWNNVLIWWMGDFFGVLLVAPLLLSLLPGEHRRIRRGRLLRSLSLPLLAVVIAFQASQQYIEERIVVNTRHKFELKAKVAENSLKRHMTAYIEALTQMEKAMARESEITKAGFEQLVRELIVELPGIRAMSWNPVVQQKDRQSFQEETRRHVAPDFTIKGEPLFPDDPLVIVKFIEPLAGNEAALGFNVYSREKRRAAILEASNNHAPTATEVLTLVQSDQEEPGFLIFRPVFDSRVLNSGAIDNHHSLRGFVVGVFLVPEIIAGSLSDELINFIDVYVFEDDQLDRKVFGNERILEEQRAGQGLGYQFALKVVNHNWGVWLHINRDVVKAMQVNDSLYYLLIEGILGTFAAFIILSAFGRHQQLSLLVKARTRELEQVNQQLETYAFCDSLTGLPNRRLFIDRMEHALALAGRQGQKVALLFMDLNRFKQVNDSLGHEVGDTLLVEVAKRFSKELRDCDTLARFGGDEFTVMLENNPSTETIMAVADRLITCLRQPIQLSGEAIITSTSIGIAVFPQNGERIMELLRGADTAMYQAKESGSGLCFYAESQRTKASRRLFMDTELPQALEKGQLELYYQPLMQLSPVRQIGCECLLRWRHPLKGVISPDNFIPAAEQSGEIVPIGYWVIDQSCGNIARWQAQGIEFDKVSVNVSARQLRDPQFINRVKQMIEHHGISAARLQFEITESALMADVTLAVAMMKRLKALGVTIAIDDYGTGYSSLSYLKEMPVDVLKIDRSFVSEMQHEADDQAIVKSTIYLAQALAIEVVAEGIETSEQMSTLTAIGCKIGQGYLFSPPLPESQFLDYVQNCPHSA